MKVHFKRKIQEIKHLKYFKEQLELLKITLISGFVTAIGRKKHIKMMRHLSEKSMSNHSNKLVGITILYFCGRTILILR